MYYDLGFLDIHNILASPGINRTPLFDKTGRDVFLNLLNFPKEGQVFYKPYLDHLKTMGEGSSNSRFFPTPEKVAAKLFRIVEAKTPRFSHNPAMDAAIVDRLLTRFLPFSWRAALNKRRSSLNRPGNVR